MSSGLVTVTLLPGQYSFSCWLVDEQLIDCHGEGTQPGSGQADLCYL